MKKRINIMLVLIMASLTFVIGSTFTGAAMELNNIQYDPAIIASGDEVDIVIQFEEKGYATESEKVGNSDYKFRVNLEADDTLTQQYVIIQDTEGDNMYGSIHSGGVYNKRFSVKVLNNAPAGNYQFKLVGQWYKDDEAAEGEQLIRFKMPVKKEGIIMDINTLETVPSEVRPGDNYVSIESYIENVGEKDSKSVEVVVIAPQGIRPAYTNNNRIWVGRINSGESKTAVFYMDLDENLEPGVYNLTYRFEYMDLDSNRYNKEIVLPFLVKSRPYIEIVDYFAEGKAGGSTTLEVTVKNTGTESAEAVDVRILKQNSQPFTMDVRSDYIGELLPGETGKAIFEIDILGDAKIKEHDIKLLIRSKGDSDEGDDNIYTYDRRAKINVSGKEPNLMFISGAALSVAVLGFLGIRKYGGKK